MKKKTVIIILAVFLLFFLFYYSIIRSEAETIYFYPSVCLGNWQNPTNAQGRPESLDQKPAQFNAENSAVFSSSGDSSREILCGGFANNTSERIDVKKLSLRLIWSNLATQSEEQIPSTEPVLPVAENVDTAEKVGTNVATFIDSGANESLVSSSTETEMPISNSETKPGIESQVASETGKSLFIIRYTFDGDNWQTLANIESIDSLTDLELPIRSLQDLPNLRFSIESTGQKKDVYLDGLSLRVDYQPEGQFSDVDENNPDFKNSELISIKSNDDYSLVLLRNQSNNFSLWLYNRAEGSFWKKIDTSDGIKSDGPLALKNDYAFWISGDGQALIGYGISSNAYFSQSIDADSNDGLSFDINNFKIKYLSNKFMLQDKVSEEERPLDDSINLNEEILADFNSEEKKDTNNLEQDKKVFDVSFMNEDLTITALEASSTDSVNLFETANDNTASGTKILENVAPSESANVANPADAEPQPQPQPQIYQLPVINDVTPVDVTPIEAAPVEAAPENSANTNDVIAD